MTTHRFFCEEWVEGATEVELSAGEASHACKVLRLREGDTCQLLNGKGDIAEAEIAEIGKRRVLCRVLSVQSFPPSEPNLRLYVAPPKGKNWDVLLKMATELGVARITPILCRYGVSRPDEAKDGWRETLIAACKQSGNPWLPQMDAPIEFSDALAQAEECGFVGMVPRGEGRKTECLDRTGGLALWVGPEGGFTAEEEEALLQKGVHPLTVGKWILRVETAVPALLGALLNESVKR